MFSSLPRSYELMKDWSWAEYEPFVKELLARELKETNVQLFLKDWTLLTDAIGEVLQRLAVSNSQDTTNKIVEGKFFAFLENILPKAEEADQNLKRKLLDSGLKPDGFEIPLRNMRAEAELFRESNLSLFVEERKLGSEYDKVIGSQTIVWQGNELTLQQIRPIYQDPDRAKREQAWRRASARQKADRETLNAMWRQFLDLRVHIAKNAGFDNYRDFRWKQWLRFDYTPQDCINFSAAIAKVVVPAASRIYERRRQRLGLEVLRPWDLDVDTSGMPPLEPYQTITELEAKANAIFDHVDARLGEYFGTMEREKLLDLDNRKGKAPGGFCTSFPMIKRPFIFMNAVGLHDDVQTLLHESGHAFHVFETAHLPYSQQLSVGMEFAEVASMSMELLASPYMSTKFGGYYSEPDAARALTEHLEQLILFWPYMSVVDSFQHWVYQNVEEAADGDHCDRVWAELWDRFIPGVDWSGLETDKADGWRRKLHIFQAPFYYVEYGLAQLGAVQVWRNALKNQSDAVHQYRKALSLGGTVPLPKLYEIAGAKFTVDEQVLTEAVGLVETKIEEMEQAFSSS